jgi:hypothetical protein
MDAWYDEDPTGAKKKLDLWKESYDYFEWGLARLMGDFPESGLLQDWRYRYTGCVSRVFLVLALPRAASLCLRPRALERPS